MRVLIDTNIFIHREDNKIISESLQSLLQIFNKESVVILLHPLSVDEIKKDKDSVRRDISLSKLGTYNLLTSPPRPDGDNEYLDTVGRSSNPHQIIDNNILYAVHKNAVDFLITEDGGIHRKASRLGIQDRIFTLDDALTTFEEMYKDFQPRYPPPMVENKVYNLDIDDEIFDSLKSEYEGFEDWFVDISKEGRDCWVHYNTDGTIGALLIYKKEFEPIELEDEVLDAKNRLKICTLIATKTGNKIGELLLKLSIEYAIKNNLEEVYLTHFTKTDDHLVDLIEEYGFSYVGKNKMYEDDVYLKSLEPAEIDLKNLFDSKGPSELSKKFYPFFYDGSEVRKFIVPIRPIFHNRLFVDYRKRQTTLYEFAGKFVIEGNTIKKAYICNSVRNEMAPGDILLFYRSHDLKEITSVGIVEKVYIDASKKEIINIVGKRTVYSEEEIEEICKKRTFVILFIMVTHLTRPIKLHELLEKNILKAAPQSITNITDKYNIIKEFGGINGSFTFD